MDIQNWFTVQSPREMSEAFAAINVTYFAAQTGAQSKSASRQIERRLGEISDAVEWFAASMYLEAVRERGNRGVRWATSC